MVGLRSARFPPENRVPDFRRVGEEQEDESADAVKEKKEEEKEEKEEKEKEEKDRERATRSGWKRRTRRSCSASNSRR